MPRGITTTLAAVVVLSMAAWGPAPAASQPAASVGVTDAGRELSVTSRLQDRREVAAGTRA